MDLPTVYPTKTAAGIVVDVQTLERVVPQSRRKDGTVRKEQKVRPGYVPQEDIGVFRSARRAAREGSATPRPVVPGSGRTADPPKSVHSFDQDTGVRTKTPPPAPGPESGPGPSTKEALKEKRAEKVEKAGVSWDEMDDDDGEDLGAAFGKLELDNKVGGREEVGTEDGSPLLQGSGVPREGAVRQSRKPGPSSVVDRQAEVAQAPSSPPLSQSRPRSSPQEQGQGTGKWYPIQGQRRKGPCGLANPEAYYERQKQEQEAKQRQRAPPPAPTLSRSDAASSWRSARRPPPSQSQPAPRTRPPSSQPSSQPPSQTRPPPQPNTRGAPRSQNQALHNPPVTSNGRRSGQDARALPREQRQPGARERKEVRVRLDGTNGRGSLADRVRNLVVANANGNGKAEVEKQGPEVKENEKGKESEKEEEEDTGGW